MSASSATATARNMKESPEAAQAPLEKAPLESAYRLHREAILSVLFTVMWMLAAHAYRWFNATSASHDSLAFYSGIEEAVHQVALGRFLEPAYIALRGGLAAPYLVGLLATAFLAMAVLLVVKLLRLRHAAVICSVAGALCTSISVTLLNASYTPWFDADMLALLLAVAAVCCCVRWRYGYAAGGVALMASMAIYQAYLPVFLGLALIVLAAHAADAKPPALVGRMALRLLAGMAIGGLLYYACMKAAIAVAGAPVLSSYNSLDGASDFSGMSLPRLVLEAYLLPIAHLVTPETHGMYLAGALNIAMALAGLAGLALLAHRNRLSKAARAMLIACVALLPLALDAVYIVAHGVVHGLMIHSFSLFYVAVLLVADRLLSANNAPMGQYEGKRQESPRAQRPIAIALVAASLVVSTCNVAYANDLYTVKDLQAQATLAQMTRIADRMDAMDGYVPGETEVVFVGSIEASSVTANVKGVSPNNDRVLLQSITGQVRSTGFFGSHAVTYLQTYGQYFNYLLGEPVALADESLAEQYAQLPTVKELPSYPSADCCTWVDGRLVVKLS